MNPPVYEIPYDWRYTRPTEAPSRDRSTIQTPNKRFPIYYFLLFLIACFLIFIVGYTVIYLLYCYGKDNPGYSLEDRRSFKAISSREEQTFDQPGTNTYPSQGGGSDHRRSNCQDKHLP
ncbi:hypothetical protein [Wufeng Crocidura attenuata henipavirus 1]|nr:hypothetical protein [Wufeng Crocidura attenuata henipavirus 1]